MMTASPERKKLKAVLEKQLYLLTTKVLFHKGFSFPSQERSGYTEALFPMSWEKGVKDLRGKGSRIRGLEGSRVRGLEGSRVQGFKGQGFKDSRIPGFKDLRGQRLQDSRTPGFLKRRWRCFLTSFQF